MARSFSMRLRAVDDEAGMHFDGDLHAVILGELARAWSSTESTFFSHCQASTSRYSGGHGQVTQFGYFALSLSPGQPEKSMTTGTPSFSASRMVLLAGLRDTPWRRPYPDAADCRGSSAR